MSYIVYILFSESSGRYYIGHTQNIEIRLHQHNSAQGNFTSKYAPWNLVWSNTISSRGEAMKLENKIKKRGARRFLNDNSAL
jgi:putative endonuclease